MSNITNIDILYYEPRDYVRARGDRFDVERWVEEHGQGYANVYYPPLPEDYIRVCHFDELLDLKQSFVNAGFKATAKQYAAPGAIPELIYKALNWDVVDRTKLLSCRKSHEGHRREGMRSMSINDVMAMTVDGVRQCIIVKDGFDFGRLPDEWETSTTDLKRPMPENIVGQCQDVTESDRGEELWRRFVFGKVTRNFPHELLKEKTGHDRPWTKKEVIDITDDLLAQIVPNTSCMTERDEKDIRKYVDDAASGRLK